VAGRVRVLLGLGSNLDPERHLPAAVERLGRHLRLRGASRVFRTAPIGRPGQPEYRNAVLAAETDLGPDRLREAVLRPVEAALGRVRTADAWAARTIDIDLLVHGETHRRIGAHPLPDPAVTERPFVAAGILDLAPEFVPPGEARPLAALVPEAGRTALAVDAELTARLEALVRRAQGDPKGER
jgi:2-amino-4-hydroxy-6-hydroxymethyldihydropteridine diphosphokinase